MKRNEERLDQGGVRNLKLPFAYCDTPELRVLDLTPEGLPSIPVLGLTRFSRGGRRTTTSAEHVHDECIEISYCRRGELVFESCGREYPFRPGCVFVSRPNEPHRLKMYPKGLLMYWMFVRLPKGDFPLLSLPRRESRWFKDRLLGMPRLFAGGDAVGKAFQHVLRVYDNVPAKTPERSLRLRSGVSDLLLALLDASEGGEASFGDDRIARVIDEIRADPVKGFTIDELSVRTAHSASGLIGRFKLLTGLPPQAFRNACRIERAKIALAREGCSIMSLALSLGYSSAQNFATQFRLATGMTPSQWRKRGVSRGGF